MPDHLRAPLAALGRPPSPGTALTGSMSGSQVYRLTLDGTEAVLKVSSAAEPGEWEAARRELDVYLTLGEVIPVRTPRLIDHVRTDDAVIMLLSAHSPAEPAVDWDHDSWLAVARDLAALHDTTLPAATRWRHRSWVVESLADPDVDTARRFWSGPGEPELLRAILRDAEALIQAITSLAPCLVHGDCHTGNLLREDGTIVWVDWQAAGVESPAVDLAFLSVRGTPDGAVPPHRAMQSEYAALRGLDVEVVATATTAAELAMLVLAWPHYAGFNAEPSLDRVRRRVADLARAWTGRGARRGPSVG